MKLAFLYAGQGSQFVGMGADFYEQYPQVRPVFDTEIDGRSLKTLCFDTPLKTLSETRNNQVAMAAFAIAVTDLLKDAGLMPAVTAGLSLGEYNALYAADVFDRQTILELLALRGVQMQTACDATPGAMAAIMGMDVTQVEVACRTAEETTGELVRVANYNTKGQYVIGGTTRAMEAALAILREQGARRAVPLAVNGAFHTPLMEKAVPAMAHAFAELEPAAAICPVISNVHANPIDMANLSDELTMQITHPVRFEESLNHLNDYALDGIIEIGPGKALAGLVKRLALKSVPMISIQQVEDLQEAIAQFGGQHAG